MTAGQRVVAFVRDRMPRPTLRGWGFMVAGVALLVVMEVLQRRDFAFLALVVLALPVLGAVGVSLYRVPLEVERRFTPELASAGTEVEVELLVTNTGLFPSPEAVWFDAVAGPLAASPRADLPKFSRGRTDRLHYTLEARHRGVHVVGPLTLLISDPFGMVVRRTPVGGVDVLTVTPSTVPLPRGAVRLASGSGSAPSSRQVGGAGEQDVISRKYQTGDSMRRVNWPASARFGELMVRQDDQQNDQHAVVILDCAAAGYAAGRRQFSASFGFSAPFEWAVSMSTSIALHLLGEGFQVRLIDSIGARFSPSSPEELLLHAARTTVLESAGSSSAGSSSAGSRTGTGAGDGADPDGSVHAGAAHADPLHADAGIDYRLALSRTESAGGDLPPVFAVIGRLADASLHSLAGAARFSSGAVAIIVVPPGAAEASWAVAEREVLESAGWTAQIITSDDAPSAAWGTVDGERLAL